MLIDQIYYDNIGRVLSVQEKKKKRMLTKFKVLK